MPSLSSKSLETTSSPYINRFLQPDMVIPDLSNPQSWNRYSYVTNRPVNFNDPTGHAQSNDDQIKDSDGKCDSSDTGCNDLVDRIKKKKDKDHDHNGCNTLGLGPKACETTKNILNGATILADGLGLGVSILEWSFVGLPLIGGVLVGGLLSIFQPEILLGLPEAAGAFLEYDAGVATMFAPFENNLALVSLATTFATDWLEGNNRISDGDVYVGTATMVSASTWAAGQIPEANIDLAASLIQFEQDLDPIIPSGSVNVSQFFGNLFH